MIKSYTMSVNKIFGCIFLFVVLSISQQVKAQELELDVQVVVPGNVLKSDPQIFRSMEQDIKDFFNRTKWTKEDYLPFEKIRGSIQVNVKNEPSLNYFSCDIIIKTERPVYNSNYKSPILNVNETGINFSYNIGQVIQRSDNVFFDNLSSTLTFYAYLILGYDADSYSLYGGDPYFQMAQEVRTALPASFALNDSGWRNGLVVGRNKFWMINDILDPRIRSYRSIFYEYHRLLLDNMYLDAGKQRAAMVGTISPLEGIIKSYPNSFALQMFLDAKRNEIVEIFKAGDTNQKTRIYNVMTEINPTQSTLFSALKN